ncbi:unnamed protein product [Caenorhabditis nigoni]
MATLQNFKDCSDIDPDDQLDKALFTGTFNSIMEMKMKAAHIPFAKTLEISCGSEQKELFKAECDKYMTTKAFKDGTKGTYGQVICCDELKFCSGPFYTQIWFFAVCGGVALLLIGIIGVVVFLLCCRKKRGGGKSGGGGRTKSTEKTTSKDKTKSEELF